MEHQNIIQALDVYYQLCSLKQKKRKGWEYWNVVGTRIESIAEHIFGAEQLAWTIYSETRLELDIYKVISMLSLHETEEILIGDITPFDSITAKEKEEMGQRAVKKVLEHLTRNKLMIDLIDEFNERKTKEAQFAYLCDKMECDLQAKKYSNSGKCSLDCVDERVLEDERVQKIIQDGAKTVEDIFIEYDKGKYEGTILEDMIHFLKDYSIKE